MKSISMVAFALSLLTSLSSFGMETKFSLNLPMATIYANQQRSPRQESNSLSYNTKDRSNQNNSQTHFLRKSGDVHLTVDGSSSTLHSG
jgi:hypothetical protein